jgi:Zn-dependent protease
MTAMGNGFDDIILRVATMMPGFLLGIVCHEAAHAYAAMRFGDSTAKNQGRLSLNPAVHYDPIGTVLFPLIGAAIGGVMFGWAKPVPVDARYFKNIRQGIFWVSFAGPIANIVLAIVSAFFLAVMIVMVPQDLYLYDSFFMMLRWSVMINIILAVFNLIPFPPLDGSKMVSTFLDYEQARKYEELQRFSFLFIIILIMTPIFSYIISPALAVGQWGITLFIRLLSW